MRRKLFKSSQERAVSTSGRRALGARFLGFSGLPVLSMIGTLLILPIIARGSSVSTWAAIGVGTSLGAVLSPVVSYGWTLIGPVRAARAAHHDLYPLYSESVRSRLAVWLTCLPVSIALPTLLLSDEGSATGAMMAIATMTVGLSPNWFAIGRGSPRIVAVYDVLPRLVAITVAAVAISSGSPVAVYPAFLLIGQAIGLTAFGFSFRASFGTQRLADRRSVLSVLRQDATAMITVATAAAYSSSCTLLTSVAASPSAVATFSSGERVYRIGQVAVGATNNSLQAWCAGADDERALGRRRKSLAFHTALGISGMIILALLSPQLTRVLFGAHLATSQLVGVALGLAFLSIAINSCLGRHVLVPTGRTRVVLFSTAAGAITGVPSVLLLAHAFGATGAAFGLAASEAGVALIQLIAAIWAPGALRSGKSSVD